MSDIELPSTEDTFFDKDHIIFYTDESGEIKCRYALCDGDVFQDLILTVLSGSINDAIIDFLFEDLNKLELKEEALSMLIVKKLLKADDDTPIVKPSNFR